MLAVALIAALCAVQDKAYDLKLDTPRKPGQKHALKESNTMKMVMKANGELAGENEEKKHYEAVEEVVAVGEYRWAFSKAERLAEGKMTPYGFAGKTVVVKVAGERTFTYADGSALAPEDLEGIKDAFDEDAGGDKDPAKLLAPGKPVKVGESWTPKVTDVAKMFEEDMASAVDPKKSSVKFTLKSVEKRDGAEYGKIEGVIELALGAMGPMKLETPLIMKMAVDLDVCVDGSSPAGVMKVKAELKGVSDAGVEGQKIKLDLDLTAVAEMIKAPAK